MTRALTPTPQYATTRAGRRSKSPSTTPVAPVPPPTPAPRAISSPTTLAQETALVASRLHVSAGRLALLTLRIMREDQPRQRHGSLAIPEPSIIATTLPLRTKPRRSKRPASQSTALATLTSHDALDTLGAISVRLRPLIRRADELLIADDGIAVLLRDPAPEGARIVARRLRDALDGHTGGSAAPTDESARYAHLLVGIGYVTFDATGAVVSNDDPCAECVGATCDERRRPDAIPARSSASADATPDAPFGAWFARLFMRAWESYAEAPITIPLVEALATRADLVTANHVTSAVVRDVAGAQRELELRRQATMLGVPFARLPSLLPGACRRAINRELASELRAIPIGYAHATLTVAMEHPCDAQAVNRLRQATGHTIFPVLGAADEISRAITQLRPS